MEPPKVAVVVVSFNTRQLLLECLESVSSNLGPASVETTVVDNASDDGSPDAVRQLWPKAHLIANSTNVGFARACNQGIASTTAPFVLLLNSDARLSATSVEALLACLSSEPKRAAAGCRLFNASGRERPSTWNFLTPFNQALELVGLNRFPFSAFSRSRRPRLDENGVDCSVDWIEASCLMLRRTAIQQVGLLDEAFFMYSEDEDLCWRLKQAGWLVCYTNLGHAVHHGGASAERQPILNLSHYYKSQYLFLLKHRGLASARLYLLANQTALFAKKTWHCLTRNQRRLSEARQRWTALKLASIDLPIAPGKDKNVDSTRAPLRS